MAEVTFRETKESVRVEGEKPSKIKVCTISSIVAENSKTLPTVVEAAEKIAKIGSSVQGPQFLFDNFMKEALDWFSTLTFQVEQLLLS